MKLINIVTNLLAAVTNTSDILRIIRIVCVVLLAISARAIIVLVLLQPSASEGMGAISGQAYDSFYSKNKARTSEGVMKILTVVFSIVILIVTIVFFITGIWFKI